MLTIRVKIIPNSKCYKWKLDANILKCYIVTPPIDGKANEEFVKRLAKVLKIKKSSIIITNGGTSRYKTIQIDTDITIDTLFKILNVLAI